MGRHGSSDGARSGRTPGASPRARVLAVVSATLAALLMAAGVATAAWTHAGAGPVSPTATTLAAPAGLAVGTPTCDAASSTGTRTVSWTGVAGATGYVVEAAQDSAFTTLVARTTATGTSVALTYPASSASYALYLRARATAGAWVGADSAVLTTSSTCTGGLPAAPTGLAADPLTCSSGTGTLPVHWNAVAGATGYTVDAAADSGFTQILQSRTVTTTSTSFSAPVPSGGYTVHLRVRATNSKGTGPASATVTVPVSCDGATTTTSPPTTTTTPPTTTPTPVPGAPTGLAVGTVGCTRTSSAYTFTIPVRWNAVSGATGYTADAAVESDFSPKLDTDTTSRTSTTLSVSLSTWTDTVYLRVRATNAAGTGTAATTSTVVSCR